jgi:hypothetical protein
MAVLLRNLKENQEKYAAALLVVNSAVTATAAVLRSSVSFGNDALGQLLLAEIPLALCLYAAAVTSALAIFISIVAIARGRPRRTNIPITMGHAALLICLQIIATR